MNDTSELPPDHPYAPPPGPHPNVKAWHLMGDDVARAVAREEARLNRYVMPPMVAYWTLPFMERKAWMYGRFYRFDEDYRQGVIENRASARIVLGMSLCGA